VLTRICLIRDGDKLVPTLECPLTEIVPLTVLNFSFREKWRMVNPIAKMT